MRQHLGNRRGNYMMTMPFFLPIMVGFAALSVDISYINMAETQVQHVADAASHAAFVGYRASNSTSIGDSAAQYILDNNLVGNEVGKLTQPIEYGEWDFDSLTLDTSSAYVNAARARVARNTFNNNSLDLFFAPILGYNTADVLAMGVTAGRTRQIVLVQDVSCSFRGTDIDNSRDADVAFLDYLHAHPYPRDMIGMTMFGGQAWYPAMYDLSLVDGNYAAMRAEFLKVNVCDELPGYMQGTPSASCATTQARGLILAREQFITHGDDREFQAVIIISDGEPNHGLKSGTNDGSSKSIRAAKQIWGVDNAGNDRRNWNYEAYGCADNNDPVNGIGTGGNYNGTYTCNNRQHNTYFKGGVHMWSVYFNQNGGQASADWMEDHMVKGMGSAYETTNSTELAAIMIEIASSIPVVLAD